MLLLGDFIELPVQSVLNVSREDGSTWATHDVIQGTPRQQFIGPGLGRLRLKLFFHIDFIGPRPTITFLRGMKDRGEIFQLWSRAGSFWGVRKIDQVDSQYVWALEDGRVICAYCDLTLSEPGLVAPPVLVLPLALEGNATDVVPTKAEEDTSRPIDEVPVEEIARV